MLCRNAKIRKKDLAEAIGITPQYLSSISSGKEPLSDSIIYKLSEYFNIDSSYFYDESEEITINEVEEVCKHIPQDIKDWLAKDESTPFLIVAKLAEENPHIPTEQIAAIIDGLRKEKDK